VDLADDRVEEPVRVAHGGDEQLVELAASGRPQLVECALLLRGRCGREGHTELVGRVHGQLIELAVLGGDLLGGLPDLRRRALLSGHLPGRYLPQSGLVQADEQRHVGRVRPVRGPGGRRRHDESGDRGDGDRGRAPDER
jgi:hypothetical protein